MSSKLYDLARETSAATGTSRTSVVLSGAASGFLSWANAGVQNGEVVSYGIQDGANSEVGTCSAAISGGVATLSSFTITKSTNSNSAISLSGSEQIFICARAEDLAGMLVATNAYTSSQTITIPAGATGARVRMKAPGGGAKGTSTTSAAGGDGGYLEKLLTGMTAGNTLVYTQGAVGAATPTAGGNSTLASGTQTISTLTCNGGGSGSSASGAGGTASGGDFNQSGGAGVIGESGACSFTTGAAGFSMLSTAVFVKSASVSGGNYGGGAASAGIATGATGGPGVLLIDWLS